MNVIKYILFLLVIFLQLECNNKSEKNSKGKGIIEFKELNFDFGNIKQGEQVAHRFIFKNTGTGDLLIKNVIPGCGCTIANYPKTSVEPGDESFIEATFNSDGYRGLCIKEVDVYTNGKPIRVTLTISAKVEVSEH
jgi:hypothetical protein